MTPAFIRSFRYTPDKGILYVMVGILVTAPILAVIYAASIGQFQWGGAIAMLTFSLVYFYFCVVAFIDSSELVVTEDGLARRIFGRNCMQTPWTGIKLIRERFFFNNRYGGEIRIDVLPNKLQGIALQFRRTIKFSDQFEDFDELIELLNSRAEQYAIRIEVASQGLWNLRSKLVANAPRQETCDNTV